MALTIYHLAEGRVHQTLWQPGTTVPADAIWLDLFAPTREEEHAVEACLAMEIPTREEMREIEISNRLYMEQQHLFMTATLLTKFDTAEPENHATTFILNERHLITVRYIDPVPFRAFPATLLKGDEPMHTAHAVFAGLMESIINRAADILEAITVRADGITKEIFPANTKSPVNYQDALARIGQCGDVASKARESLTTLWRLVAYAQQNIKNLSPEVGAQLTAHGKDITALNDHAAFISSKVSFLLDATLGMISIEQNNIIKIFSIAAVVFLPPTLVASIYGMNFEHMPELGWKLGYPMALGLMVVAAVLPVLYFKRKKWL
ncbi:MAG: magnesium transporter [Azospirillum brasilense]|nr:MAG: magnesium transporter [Azospirillum brasilense]